LIFGGAQPEILCDQLASIQKNRFERYAIETAARSPFQARRQQSIPYMERSPCYLWMTFILLFSWDAADYAQHSRKAEHQQ
jgi:hypothetical protein